MRAPLFILTATVVLLGACANGGSDDRAGGGPGTGTLDRAELERFAGVELPEGARIGRSSAERGIDTRVAVSIAMNAADVESFVSGSGLPPLREGYMPVQAGVGDDLGWDLKGAAGVEGTDDRTSGGVYRQVAVTRSGDRATVYLHAFST